MARLVRFLPVICALGVLQAQAVSELQAIEIGAMLSAVTTEESLDSAARIVTAFSQDEQFLKEYVQLCAQSIRLVARTLRKNLSVKERECIATLVEEIVTWQSDYMTLCSDVGNCESEQDQQALQDHLEKLHAFLRKPIVASLLYYGLLSCAELQEESGADFIKKMNATLQKGVQLFKDELL